MPFCAVPETTIFIVVSGTHTGVVLVDVPGTTTKIVVLGTSTEKGKPAEPQKGGNSRMKACFGVLCLKPLFLTQNKQAVDEEEANQEKNRH